MLCSRNKIIWSESREYKEQWRRDRTHGETMSKTVHRNVNDHEKGAVTLIEAVIVFPIMFIIVFIMMMAGNAYYQQARVERAVVETTLNASME